MRKIFLRNFAGRNTLTMTQELLSKTAKGNSAEPGLPVGTSLILKTERIADYAAHIDSHDLKFHVSSLNGVFDVPKKIMGAVGRLCHSLPS